MFYSIDGNFNKEKVISKNEKIVSKKEQDNKVKIKEEFLNLPFFHFASATNAGLKSTENIESEKNAIIKGDLTFDGKLIHSEKELDIDLLKEGSKIWQIINDKDVYYDKGVVRIGTKDKYNHEGTVLHLYGGSKQTTLRMGETGKKDKSCFIHYSQGGGSGSGKLMLGHWGSSARNGININFNGNIGIGTMTPQCKLDVNGALIVSPESIERNYAGGGGNQTHTFCLIFKHGRELGLNLTSNGSLTGHIGGGGAFNKQWQIGSGMGGDHTYLAGNVGIGTSSPTGKLEVAGTSNIYRNLNKNKSFVLSGGDYGAGQALLGIDGPGSGQKLVIQAYRNGKVVDGKVPKSYDNPGEITLNPHGGNVGIGTSKPVRKLDIDGSLRANSINPFPGNDSGTYYSRWNFYSKKRLTHFICAFQVDHKNVQTTIEIDFSMVYTKSKNGTHNRNKRTAGKLIFNMVSSSPSNKENASRGDGNWYIRYSCDNSNYVVDGQMGTGPDFYFLRKNDSCYLLAAIGQTRSDGGTYTGMFKVNIMDPFLKGFHMFTDNETKKAEANIEPYECHKYDPGNQRPDNYKEDNFPGEYKFADKDYHTWMKIVVNSADPTSFKQGYHEKKLLNHEIKSRN